MSLCAAAAEPSSLAVHVDPLTRYIHVTYPVPTHAPDEVTALCAWSAPGKNEWRPAKVTPLISETAMALLDSEEWNAWVKQGRITERRAAGLKRTAVFNPYPDVQADGRVNADFRIQLLDPSGTSLASYESRLEADNTDVVYIEDWSKVLQQDAVATDGAADAAKWQWRTGEAAIDGSTFGNDLYGNAGTEKGLRQLTYPLDLHGHYAIFVCNAPGQGDIRMRLSRGERKDRLSSRYTGEEVLWRRSLMDRQNLILLQNHWYTGCAPSHLDYVKLVPLSAPLTDELDAQFGEEADKLVVAYWEPYSHAFCDDVQDTLWHREYLSAYRDARIPVVDMQINRFGMKAVYETRASDPLLYATQGDPIGNVKHPTTDNVGRMQQYTNTLEASLRYAKEFGFRLHANFGATNCYPGSPLQGDFSKAHPDWMRGSALRYEVPEVRAYILSMYREALEIGARALSIDFCRYPEGIDTRETCNAFFAQLRTLADEFAAPGERIPILVRFPGTGVRRCEMFDYATWAREGWVDYLCPSNIQGRHLHIDPAPYFDAVRGTECIVLPALDGLSWGQPMPGPFLWRTAQLYDAGAPGIYVYQGDSPVFGPPYKRRTMRMLTSSAAVRAWLANEDAQRPRRSKGIYITGPLRVEGYAGWHRLRVWTEGIHPGPVEFYLDGALAAKQEAPPYLLGAEDYGTDGIIPKGEHELRIRAKDGSGWLEQTFTITGG